MKNPVFALFFLCAAIMVVYMFLPPLEPQNPIAQLNPRHALRRYMRGKDYAHPGDEKAVRLVIQQALEFNPLLKDKAVVDVGCGCGGTVNLFGDCGFRNVQGFDIDQPSIEYAKKTYPTYKFSVHDALTIDQHMAPRSISFFTMFSTLVFIHDKKRLFDALANLAEPGALIAIWDYVKPKPTPERTTRMPEGPSIKRMSLSTLKELHADLDATGWDVILEQDLTHYFTECYQILLRQLQDEKADLERRFTPEVVAQAYEIYLPIAKAFELGEFEGALIFAKKR